MPTNTSDAAALGLCALAIVAGLTLVALGLIIDPTRALLRRT